MTPVVGAKQIPTKMESPEHVRLSLAAAMTLGFVKGWFYRNARLRCVNLLLTYESGCKANCSFCGLAREKELVRRETHTGKKFIRVPWQTYPAEQVLDGLKGAPDYVGRVCISMITHPRCREDVLDVCRRVTDETGLAVSLLISPTLLQRDDLIAMKDSGAERIGVAIDGATPEIFDKFRGKPVRGPHRWDKYWNIYEQSLEVFGEGMVGVHLICGLGETEEELVDTISRANRMGGSTHLFSFFPETGSALEDHPSPSLGTYRRIQLARWLIDNDLAPYENMVFDQEGKLIDFGIAPEELNTYILLGEPFETSGCPGPDGRVACNRPYGNEKPGSEIRNFPFRPTSDDINKIMEELKT